MIVFNTDGIAGGSAGTWRGAYEYIKFRHQRYGRNPRQEESWAELLLECSRATSQGSLAMFGPSFGDLALRRVWNYRDQKSDWGLP
ncbi:unnamed protein product [Ascophyllum nodosum]